MIAHGGKVFCAIHFQTVTAGKINVKYETCMDGKNFVPSKSLSAITSYKQWEDLEVPRNLKYQDIIFGTKYKGKDKFFSGLFIETLYKEHILPIETV